MSPLRNWSDPAADAAAVARSRQAWDKIMAARRTVTAADAQAASTMAANYPHMSPGTVIPLAKAGVAPDDPLAQRVALEEAKSNKKKRGFFGAVGDFVNPVHLIGAVGEGLVGHVLDPIGGAALGAAKQVLRPGLAALAAPYEVGTGVFRDIAAAGGEIAAGVTSGAAVGAAAGLAPAGPTAGLSVLAGAGIGAVVGGIAGGISQLRGTKIEHQGGIVNPLSQSTLFQSFGSAGLGSGYMPGGTAHEQAVAASQRAAAISGHALTPGRFLATSVTEPGTTPYNLLSGSLDAAVAWELDPTAIAGKSVNRAREAARGFTATEREITAAGRLSQAAERADAGLVEGSRKTVIGEKVDAWLGTRKGQNATSWFAEHGFEDIRQKLGNTVKLDTVRDLADATTPEEVAGILRPQLGIERGLEMKPRVGGFGMEVQRVSSKIPMYDKVKDSRLWSDLPSGHIDYNNPTEATHQFNLLLRDANVPVEEAAKHTEAFGRSLLEGTYEGRRAADYTAYKAMGGAQGKVGQSEAGRSFMNRLAKRAADGDDKVMKALIAEDVTNTPSTRVSIGGKTHGLASSGFLTEHFDNGIDLDRATIRNIRAATSKYARIANNPKFQTSVSAMAGMTDNVWKPAALLRGAWTVRVVGEEQIRMAAAGRLSLLNHPLSYLAWAMDDDGKIANTFKRFGMDVGGRGAVDIAGERFAREGSTIEPSVTGLDAELHDLADSHFGEATNYRMQAEAWQGDGFTAAGHDFTYTRGMPGHVEATAEKIDQAAADPVMAMLASQPRAAVRKWFVEGEGNALRQEAIKRGAQLRTDAQIDAHLDNARKQLDNIMGRVEEVRPGVSVPGGTATGPSGPSGSSYGAHPGIEARGAAPAAPTAPGRPGFQPAPERYGGVPAAPRSQSPAELGYAERSAAHEREMAQRARTEEMNARYRAQSAGGAAPTGPSYGNASTQTVPRIEAPQITHGTPGSSTIRQAIADGQINGVPFRLPNGKPNPEFVSELRKIEDELPNEITGAAAHVPNDRWKAKRDSAVQHMFTTMMTRPSAKLSRSPMFRQHYWSEADNLITEMDRASQAKLLASAETAKLDSAAIKRLRQRAQASSGELSLAEADHLLKGRALDTTQSLLYDAAQRGQISDVMRIVMPFAEAQKEVMGVWTKMGLVDNVNIARRAAQTLDAARGSGVFYKDPGTGEEMFTFPFSSWATEHLPMIGMPIPLTGRVSGLNTFGSGIIPGMGPAVQIPTRYLLPDKPQYDSLRKFIDPYGASADQQEGLLESQFPGWLNALRTGLTADDSDRSFANAVKDVWAQGVSAGRYSTATPDDIREGLDHAKSTARWLYIIKAGASVAGAPTPPSPAFMAMDKDGKWHMAKALSEDYRAMIDDPNIGFEGANAAFINKYGNNASAFMQAKTFATTPSAPSTGEFRQWTRSADAQELQKKYGDTYALFGPQGEGFDYTQYLRNIKSGATETLTPEQFAEQTNNRQAQMIYYNYKDRFGPAPSKEQRDWLSNLRLKLRVKFPGYDIPVPGKPDADTVKKQFIPEIERAVTDPALKDNDVARAARAYLAARTQALAAAESAGYKTFAESKNAAPLRDWLRQVLSVLTQKVPDFGPMADRVFDREMVDDTAPAQTGVSA